MRYAPLITVLLAACDLMPATFREETLDPDGDGVPWPEDCDSTRGDAFPGAEEVWYDGVDQDCAGDDDFDQDGDGAVAAVAGGDDCWDDPASIPAGFAVVVGEDALGQPLAWLQPAAADVHPGATDTWYDGVDQDCAGDDDFDQDGDGFATDDLPHPVASGGTEVAFGDDCIDDPLTAEGLDAANPAGTAAADVHPGAEETWYDGTDQDCDEIDCDADGDGHEAPLSAWCTISEDCDDQDPDLYFDPDRVETWYNGVDENCDANDGDQDGDGWWAADYEDRVRAAGGEPLAVPPAAGEGDCWDDPAEAADHAPVGGFPALAPEDVHPDAPSDTWYDGIDQDCDGASDFDQDGDGYESADRPQADGATGTDCLDEGVSATGRAAEDVFPGQLETWYDGTDDDCDGNDCDRDGDGWCWEGYAGEVPTDRLPGDCDDSLGGDAVHPGAVEDCDTAADDDCSGTTNDHDAIGCALYYVDADEDGFGEDATAWCTCAPDGTHFTLTGGDCDDADAARNPLAEEVCDDASRDEDCDGLADDADASVDPAGLTRYFPDADGDGWGDASDAGRDLCRAATPWVVTDATDCDDTAAAVHPGALEVCDDGDVDEDCDGLVDGADGDVDAATLTPWWPDDDGDGYGSAAVAGSFHCLGEAPAGWLQDATDCDDAVAAAHPGGVEVCGGSDEDCDGLEDVGAIDAPTWYRDGDGDGFGTSGTGMEACARPLGYVSDATDCDDAVTAVNPSAAEVCDASRLDEDCDGLADDDEGPGGAEGQVPFYPDRDGDGYGDTEDPGQERCVAGEGYSAADASDCDDKVPDIHPGGVEVCDTAATDEDCDGLANDADPDVADPGTWYADADLDGFGDPGVEAVACEIPSGYGADATDCDDTTAEVSPAAVETCNDRDDDCDGGVDEGLLVVWYADGDGDTYGDAAVTESACVAPSGYVPDGTDCDDSTYEVSPGAAEDCDGVDDDCDGTVDEGLRGTWYEDADGDGYGAAASSVEACDAPVGYVVNPTDCDDLAATVNPGASEVCDAFDRDEDCDGLADDDDASAAGGVVLYLDQDGDGDGDRSDAGLERCDPEGFRTAASATDCDDGDATRAPHLAEVADEVDNDCDDVVDEGYRGYGDLLVTEFMYSAGPGGGTDCSWSWFEVYNPGSSDLDLAGMEVAATTPSWTRTFFIGTDGLVVAAGGYAVLCADDARVQSLTVSPRCDYTWGADVNGVSAAGDTWHPDFCISSDPTVLSLSVAGQQLDTVEWRYGGPWPEASWATSIELGASSLDPDANDRGWNWCEASDWYFYLMDAATPEIGWATPGEANACSL